MRRDPSSLPGDRSRPEITPSSPAGENSDVKVVTLHGDTDSIGRAFDTAHMSIDATLLPPGTSTVFADRDLPAANSSPITRSLRRMKPS
jgi:hypothetical protein